MRSTVLKDMGKIKILIMQRTLEQGDVTVSVVALFQRQTDYLHKVCFVLTTYPQCKLLRDWQNWSTRLDLNTVFRCPEEPQRSAPRAFRATCPQMQWMSGLNERAWLSILVFRLAWVSSHYDVDTPSLQDRTVEQPTLAGMFLASRPPLLGHAIRSNQEIYVRRLGQS